MGTMTSPALPSQLFVVLLFIRCLSSVSKEIHSISSSPATYPSADVTNFVNKTQSSKPTRGKHFINSKGIKEMRSHTTIIKKHDITGAKTETNCSNPNGWNLRGSDWGCCGNYVGCCTYASFICYVHDAMCRCCDVSANFCGPKCVPENDCIANHAKARPEDKRLYNNDVTSSTSSTTRYHEDIEGSGDTYFKENDYD